jgi:hypothetical protein
MSALTGIRTVAAKGSGRRLAQYQFVVKAGEVIYQGAAFGVDPSTGKAEPMNGTDNTLICYGVADYTADGDGVLGPTQVIGRPGVYPMTGSGLGYVDVGSVAYATSDQDIDTSSNADARPKMGLIEYVESATVAWVAIDPPGKSVSVAGLESDLASTANGLGASKVGIEDPGGFTTETELEGATQEIYQHLKSAHVVLPINLAGAILAAGTPMAAFADSATSDPGITLANSKAVGIRWNNAATQIAIWLSVVLPLDLDPASAMTLVALASKTGATSGDATTFTVTMFAQTVGALHDAGSDLGGTTSAMTGTATAKTVQRVTLSIATPPTPPAALSLSIKPTNGLLGTDDVIVEALYLEYKRKLLTS